MNKKQIIIFLVSLIIFTYYFMAIKDNLKYKLNENLEKKSADFIFKGYKLIDEGKYKEAINEFDKSIKIFPNGILAYSGKEKTLKKLNENEKQINEQLRIINSGLTYSNAHYDGYFVKGKLLYEQGKYDEALDNYLLGLEKAKIGIEAYGPDGTKNEKGELNIVKKVLHYVDKKVYFEISEVYKKLGNKEKSEEFLLKYKGNK